MDARVDRVRRDVVVAELVVHAERAPVGRLDLAALERGVDLGAGQRRDADAELAPDRRAHALGRAHLDALESP